MSNSLLLILQLILFYSFTILAYRLFGKEGLIGWTVLATVAANIEVLIQVEAFGMQMTLGNILFATSFTATDILSETEGKKEANRLAEICILISALFTVITQTWLLFTPGEEDFVFDSVKSIFHHTPRLVISSLAVFAVVQKLDIFLYHLIWEKTGNTHKGLWIRNNAATLISQAVNAVAFNFLAFFGKFSMTAIWQIAGSTFLIYIITSLADTPVVYICRRIHENTLH